MRSRFFVVFGVVFAAFVVAFSAVPAFSQGNISVLFDGTALVGKTNFLNDSGGLNRMKTKSAVFPGVEARFNQKGRVTLGVSYQRWELAAEPEHFTIMLDPVTGQEVAGVTLGKEAGMNALVSTVYINLLTRGGVRPFLGIGGGANFTETKFRASHFVTPGLDFQFENPNSSWSEKRVSPAVKAVAGVNFFPVNHFVVSLSSGYINGPAVSFGAGFTF